MKFVKTVTRVMRSCSGRDVTPSRSCAETTEIFQSRL